MMKAKGKMPMKEKEMMHPGGMMSGKNPMPGMKEHMGGKSPVPVFKNKKKARGK